MAVMIESLPQWLDPAIFVATLGGIAVGVQFERWRAAAARREWRAKRAARSGFKSFKPRGSRPATAAPVGPSPAPDVADQLRIVMASDFTRRRLLNTQEAKVFHAAEEAIARAGKPWRAMAQVSLGEILSSPNDNAHRAINSKRVDILIVCNRSLPIAAIEYQGGGHYQGTAPVRDAVKKEALRRAGVRYIEMLPDHGPSDLAREVERLAAAEREAPVVALVPEPEVRRRA